MRESKIQNLEESISKHRIAILDISALINDMDSRIS